MAKRNRSADQATSSARPTRRQLASFERERQQRRLLFGVVGAAVLLIVGLIGYGLLRDQVLEPRETVLTINGTHLSREMYWKVRRLEIGRQLQQLQFQTQFGGQNTQLLNQRMEALQRELRQYRSTPLDIPTLEKMANEELLRQRAASLGVGLSPAELQAEAELEFAPPPATSTPVTTAEASQTAAAATTAATQTPRSSPTEVEGSQTGTPGTPRPTSTPTSGPTATSTPFITPTATISPTALSTSARATAAASYRDQIGALRQVYGVSLDDYRELIVLPRLLEQRVKERLAERAPTVQPQVRVAHILVANEETAAQLKTELDRGADFAALARQHSTDSSNKEKGGDLDWFPRGIMAAEFERAAFSQAVDVVGPPVQTQFGWHLIKVLESSDSRPVAPALLEQVRESAYDNWLKEQRANSSVTAAVPLPSFAPTPTPGPSPSTAPLVGTPRG
jgi:parvulin-like peptidyl-prolyl isomerase